MAVSTRFLTRERHHVGDGADSDEVRVRAQGEREVDQLLPALLEQSVRELERHSHAGEMRARVAPELG